MTDKIYGARGASVAMSAGYSNVRSEEYESYANAPATPIEDSIERIDQAINRLFAVTDTLHVRLEPYMRPSSPTAVANEKLTGANQPTSALGNTLLSFEIRLRDLELQLSDIHSRVER